MGPSPTHKAVVKGKGGGALKKGGQGAVKKGDALRRPKSAEKALARTLALKERDKPGFPIGGAKKPDRGVMVRMKVDFPAPHLWAFPQQPAPRAYGGMDFGNKSARVYTEHIDFGSTGKAFLKSIKRERELAKMPLWRQSLKKKLDRQEVSERSTEVKERRKKVLSKEVRGVLPKAAVDTSLQQNAIQAYRQMRQQQAAAAKAAATASSGKGGGWATGRPNGGFGKGGGGSFGLGTPGAGLFRKGPGMGW